MPRTAQFPFVVAHQRDIERLYVSDSDEAVADWRHNQISYKNIHLGYCIIYAIMSRAVGDIQFCRNLLLRQLHQAVAVDVLTHDLFGFVSRINPVANLNFR